LNPNSYVGKKADHQATIDKTLHADSHEIAIKDLKLQQLHLLHVSLFTKLEIVLRESIKKRHFHKYLSFQISYLNTQQTLTISHFNISGRTLPSIRTH
jgi:hypothetical protein